MPNYISIFFAWNRYLLHVYATMTHLEDLQGIKPSFSREAFNAHSLCARPPFLTDPLVKSNKVIKLLIGSIQSFVVHTFKTSPIKLCLKASWLLFHNNTKNKCRPVSVLSSHQLRDAVIVNKWNLVENLHVAVQGQSYIWMQCNNWRFKKKD